MNKNYKFNSISLDVDDGVLENIFNANTDKEIFNLSNYPLKELPSNILISNNNVKEVILPETLEVINSLSIFNCDNIEKINIPKSVNKIMNGDSFLSESKMYYDENNWFGNCFVVDGWVLKLRGGDVIVPNNVKLASSPGGYSSNITSIHFSSNIEEIPDNFAEYLTGVIKITFDDNSKLKRIGSSALYCPNMTEITIPASVEYLGIFAIQSNKLEKVYITNLKNFCNIERTNISIYGSNYDLYLGNTAIKNLTFPSDLKIIKQGCFSGSNIESIIIPNTITEIGSFAFNDCKKLKSITFNGAMSQWKSINKEYYWYDNILATYVQCTDGQVQL